jgi:hypothetical protein
VTKGLAALPPPTGLEAKALMRIQAPPGMRLACQISPTTDLTVTPLLAADANAADGTVRGGLEGSERLITVVFVDLRGSTTLGEVKMPYDVLYILNQFFHEMNKALIATNGHYSQFTGDGLMALYGLNDADPARGAADAVRGAREMLTRVEQINARLHADLAQPLRIGIGIHFSEAIVGAMGPPRSQITTGRRWASRSSFTTRAVISWTGSSSFDTTSRSSGRLRLIRSRYPGRSCAIVAPLCVPSRSSWIRGHVTTPAPSPCPLPRGEGEG